MSLNRLLTRRVRRAALALCAAAVLSACGGGDRSEPFVPGRIFAFGDELNVLQPAASVSPAPTNASGVPLTGTLKYGVNGISSTDTTATVVDCTLYPLWIQSVASQFGMAFAECPGTVTAENQRAYDRAAVGAKVAELETQVATYLASDNPASNDLVTMLVGSNDVLDVYNTWDQAGRTDAASTVAITEIKARAERLAAQVNLVVVKTSAPVLISTIPYLSASPFATSEELRVAGSAQMLLNLVEAFNGALVSGGVGPGTSKGLAFYGLTGRDFGLIQVGTSWIKNIATSSDGTVQGYAKSAMCPSSAALPGCTTTDVTNNGGDVNTWVWADATRPGPLFQSQLGSRAVTMTGSSGLPF